MDDNWWIAVVSFVGPLLAAGIGYKFAQAKKLIVELGEAVMATGLLLLKIGKAIEDNKLDSSEKDAVFEQIRIMTVEYKQALAVAATIFSKAKR